MRRAAVVIVMVEKKLRVNMSINRGKLVTKQYKNALKTKPNQKLIKMQHVGQCNNINLQNSK